MSRQRLDRVIGSVYLNRDLEAWLRKQAEKANVSKSELINRAVAAYRNQQDESPDDDCSPSQEQVA